MCCARRRCDNGKGFTLIELMIVIVIIGILATLLIPRIMERPEEARRVKAKMDIKAIVSALKLYKIDCGSYPTTDQGLIALIKKPDTPPVPNKWREAGTWKARMFRRTPGATLTTIASPTEDGKDYEIISYGADGEPGGTGKNADISSSDLSKD